MSAFFQAHVLPVSQCLTTIPLFFCVHCVFVFCFLVPCVGFLTLLCVVISTRYSMRSKTWAVVSTDLFFFDDFSLPVIGRRCSYVPSLERIVVLRLLAQLSSVYHTVTLEKLQVCPSSLLFLIHWVAVVEVFVRSVIWLIFVRWHFHELVQFIHLLLDLFSSSLSNDFVPWITEPFRSAISLSCFRDLGTMSSSVGWLRTSMHFAFARKVTRQFVPA